jgi:hypothetical protein
MVQYLCRGLCNKHYLLATTTLFTDRARHNLKYKTAPAEEANT